MMTLRVPLSATGVQMSDGHDGCYHPLHMMLVTTLTNYNYNYQWDTSLTNKCSISVWMTNSFLVTFLVIYTSLDDVGTFIREF